MPQALPNLRFTHRTLTPLVLHTYVHNPEVDIAEGAAAAAAHARTREGNFWIFASEAQILRRPPLA